MDLHVSQHGSGVACSRDYPCSLQSAQIRVRQYRRAGVKDVRVLLADGLYRLHRPLVFKERDSGTLGHPVIWTAESHAHPVLAGSRPLDHWHVLKNGLWSHSIKASGKALHLFVNGQRRFPSSTGPCKACRYSPRGLTNVPAAITRQLRTGAVVVIHVRWRDFHCRVASVEKHSVRVAQPCWHNTAIDSKNGWSAASPKGKYYQSVERFDNIHAMPRKTGHFAIDDVHHRIVYKPLPGESPDTVKAESPLATHLLVLEGNKRRGQPVHDIVFKKLGFSYTRWMQPLTDDGYVSLQAGYLVIGLGRTRLPNNGEGMMRIPAAVTVRRGSRIAFDDDAFLHLGAAGIALVRGTRDSGVVNSYFTDISGGAIFAGDTWAHPGSKKPPKSADIDVCNNIISHIGVDYRDNVAIMAGFVNDVDISHNTIHDISYSGISVGWGWNYEGKKPVEKGVHIDSNRIYRVMKLLQDGGAIYTQGASTPGTSWVKHNFIDMRDSGKGNGIYLDEHSQWFDVEHNIVLGSWISAWASWSGHLRIVDNWTNRPGKPHHQGPSKVWSPNFTHLETLPYQALKVEGNAGAHLAKGFNDPVKACKV